MLLQNRLPTADRINRRGCQANPIYSLCYLESSDTMVRMAGNAADGKKHRAVVVGSYAESDNRTPPVVGTYTA
jgi:hypothetical protein